MNTTPSISRQHISFRAASELKEFCRHFFSSSQVDCFYFLKSLDDKRMSVLTLAPDCNKYIVEQGLACAGQEFTPGIHYLPFSSASTARRKIIERFRIYHNLEFVEQADDGPELFGFSTTTVNPEVVNSYFNQLEDFQNFIKDFKSHADILIKQALKEPINLPVPQAISQKNINEFTKREIMVLRALYQGCSAKETAQQLNLSPRTVESYLENVKNKLGLSKKVELVKYIMDHNLASEVIAC